MNRRNFIRLSTLTGSGLLLSFSARGIVSIKNDAYKLVENKWFGNFLMITPEGDILFQLTKHEMGQGVSTGLSMILSEELCADYNKVRIEMAEADLTRYQNTTHGGLGTGGSTTISDMWPILRHAGATAREMLIQSAATQWGIESRHCTAENHWVINKISGDKLGFGALAEGASTLSIPEKVVLKDPANFTLIGKSVPGKLIPAIATGKQKYGIDTQVAGMFYAVVARCPVYRGKLISYDASDALKIKGVKKVVTTTAVAGIKGHFQYDVREGVAVVADSFWAAKKGRDALKIVWDEVTHTAGDVQEFEQRVEEKGSDRTDPTGFVGDDNAMADLTLIKNTVRATYVYPYQLHSPMEPLNCTAHFKGEAVEIWTGSQAPHFMIREVAKFFKLATDKVKLHVFPSGGGFGRRWYPDAALEAVCISREAGNIPVKVVWTREDDHQFSFAHCYTWNNYQAGISESNEVVTWYQKELRSYTWGSQVANPELTWIGYKFPNIRYDFENLLKESLIQSCAWRSVVANSWAFGQECFIDELAVMQKRDPLEFRLSLLPDGWEANVGHSHKVNSKRLKGVLNLVAEKSGWGKAKVDGHGYGIAAYPYMHGDSYIAMVAEVTVTSKVLTIHKVTCAVDAGLIVNPSSVRNQIEGGIVWGMTALLYGGVDFKKGKAVNSNFHQNKLVRNKECPAIDIYFVDTHEISPTGIGELAPPVAVPAILNAIFSATGKRIRRLPVLPDDL